MTGTTTRPERPAHALILCVLFCVAFSLRFFYAQADPFLHDWDERFHALVARNLMHDPFKPMLVANPLAAYDFKDWTGNHIWLHKQPLFMWQMALSMKLFGVSELTLRLPNVVMGSLMVLMLFRIAYLFTADTMISLLAATLLCFSHYHLELIGAMRSMDHNDVALGFYVLAGIWAYAEYLRRKAWHWTVLIGGFAGCAILNKWLVGLAVFLGWGVNILLTMRQRSLRRDAGHFLLALLVCCFVFVPWQVYIAHRWPEEARYEYEINNRHLTEVLQGHGGSVWYYAESAPDYFGKYLWVLIPVGIALAVSSRTTNKRLLAPFLAIMTFVFCFFSFAVKTKMDSYVFFAAPLCMIFLAYGLVGACRRAGFRSVWALTFVVSIYLSLVPQRILMHLSARDSERNLRVAMTRILKSLRADLPADVKVVVNTSKMENLDLMFYNNELSAYPSLSEAEVGELLKRDARIAAFKSDGKHDLPGYLSAYPRLYVIDKGHAFRDVFQ